MKTKYRSLELPRITLDDIKDSYIENLKLLDSHPLIKHTKPTVNHIMGFQVMVTNHMLNIRNAKNIELIRCFLICIS